MTHLMTAHGDNRLNDVRLPIVRYGNYRPKSRSKKPSLPDSASVEAHYQTNNDQVMQEEPHGKHIEFLKSVRSVMKNSSGSMWN